jgi:hypothetical protein
MLASTRACGRSRFESLFLAGCALIVAAVCTSCEASTDETEAIGRSSSALAVAGLFATGVNAMGTRLAVGSVDPHYVLSSNDATAPGPDALTVTPAAGWVAAGAASRWISIRASTDGTTGDVYTYTTTFTLAGVDPTSATLSGRWACDDSCVLKLNGTQVASNPNPAWLLATNFTVPAGSPFQLGTNTLDFVVTNTTGGPTGLQVLSITGTVSGCTADDQCSTTQFCNTQSATCVPKLANGAPVPTVTGHTPPLTGACTAAAGSAVCTAGVCDTSDNDCGLGNGDGPCTPANAGTVCRSGACSVANTCEPAGGCNVDADCTGGDWCDEATHVCTPKLANGSPIPSDPTHTAPTLTGVCTATAGKLVCASGVCDVADNLCGLADGDGPCTGDPGVCRSGTCGPSGTCGSGGTPADAGAGEDAGLDAAGGDGGGGADAGADAAADAGAGDAGTGEDAGEDAGPDAGEGADGGADAAPITDGGEADADASGHELADASAGEDAGASEDAGTGGEADGGEDATTPEGEDAAQAQGGSLQGGGFSCGISRSTPSGPGGAALGMLVTLAMAVRRGRRKR